MKADHRYHFTARLLWLVTMALILCCLSAARTRAQWESGGGSSEMNKRETGNGADKNLRSLANVNPSTLAMEMSIPLMTYPGRSRHSLPVEFRYSSKVWNMKMAHAWWYWDNAGHKQFVTDTYAHYAERAAAGWTSSLVPPRIDESLQTYNIWGKPYGDSVNEIQLGESFGAAIIDVFMHDIGDSPRPGTGCIEICTQWVQTGVDGDLGPWECGDWGYIHCSDPLNESDPTSNMPTPTYLYYVQRLRVVMPDGSSHEFRQSDERIYCGNFGPNETGCVTNFIGTYYAVDGSGMTLVKASDGTYRLYTANGGFYDFPQYANRPLDGLYATKFTDVNGNILTFAEVGDEDVQTWTDTLGRQIVDPLPHNYDAQTQSPQVQDLDLPGLGGTAQHYELTWQHLKPVGCENSDDPDCISYVDGTRGGALEDQRENLYYSTRYMCQGNLRYDLVDNPDHPEDKNEVLFPGVDAGVRPCNGFDILRDENGDPILGPMGEYTSGPVRFNPVVLSEIKLPNNLSYRFLYNRFGEISRVIYPTGAYETFVYSVIPQLTTNGSTYEQTNRGVTERRVYDSNGVLQQRWTYGAERYGLVGNIKYRVTTVEPKGDNALGSGITSVSYLHIDDYYNSKFGFSDPRSGRPYDERTYDENGILRSRVLTEYITKDSNLSFPYPAYTVRRDAREKRKLSLTFEPGSSDALATLTETTHDETGSSDAAHFSHLNVKSRKSYHFVAVTVSAASSETLDWSTVASWFPASKLAAVSEIDYLYNSNYKDRHIVGLATETRQLDPANTASVLAKTQTVHDENDYLSGTSANLPATLANTWIAPSANPSIPANLSSLRGMVTTSKVWDKENNAWIESHTQYDQYGNVRKVWEPNEPITSSRYTNTEYSPDLGCALPTAVTVPAPDPTNTTGTNASSTVTTGYDFNTGLPTSVTDDFGQVTTTEYSDALLRPTRVNPVVVNGQATGPVAETIYDDVARTVKVRKQLDGTNWDEATTFMDSHGRTIKTQAKDSQGDVFVETHYDLLGRVDRVSNPYRAGDTVLWSKTRYDIVGRAVETYAPATIADINANNLTSLGTTSFGISNVTNYVGPIVTTTDASLRKGRSITNALGQLIRVDEPTAVGGTADADLGSIGTPTQATYYTYDAYGKMVKVVQGAQTRYFKYDSLGRLIRVRQPEQEYNSNLNLSDSYNLTGQWTAGFSYDVLGNLVRATDANGVNIVNEYDKASRVTKRCYTKPNVNSTATNCAQISSGDVSVDTPTVAFWYDGKGLAQQQSPNYGKGKLTKVDNGISATEYMTFDNFGRLTRSRQLTDGVVYGTDQLPNLRQLVLIHSRWQDREAETR